MKAGWEVKTLGDVCEYDKLQAIHKNLPYVGLEDIESNTASFLGSLESQSVKSATFKFNNSHILYGRLRPYLNKVLAPEFDGHCSTEIFPIKPKSCLLRDYLLYWFIREQTVDLINATCTGARMPRADMNAVLSFEFLLPPIQEQQRIVAILDKAFEQIAIARANTEKNLQNARALFESHLQNVFTQRGDGWKERRLGDIAEVQSGGTPSVPQKQYWNGDIPWYSSGELNNTYTTESEKKITLLGLDNSNAKLFPKGSLLVGMYDTAALKMSILDRDATFNQAIAGIKPNEMIDVKYILHAINSKKPALLLERRGVRQKNLSLGKIKDISIPLPDLVEQQTVVSNLQKVLSETQRLESLYQRKLNALDALKKSLLHQAFAGEL
ncbi:restriction endonuclease subunit S [Methylophilus aquaticus]|uniref:Restriction endonuclease subunit S n=1 Tax=Methylophilus aquaticus TaxID=1971610 RepID=A0ABT9JVP7_9PROT|nr:restriction endonuclease subunit S [Methylophilus aquaticus]MDP8568150.1 restriction endonuclease subunit S [Methylophilus aquaticus]